MIHTIAFSESIDAGGTLVNIAAVVDPSLRTEGDNVVVPRSVNQIFAAQAMVGTTATRAYLISPKLRRLNPYEIQPLITGLVPTDTPDMPMHPENPVPLEYNENLTAEFSADPAAAEQVSIIVWFTDGPIQPQGGELFRARFRFTGAATAGIWNNYTIDFIDELPSGVYACGGSYLSGTGFVAARWYPIGGEWRPGFAPTQNLGQRSDMRFRDFRLGRWFEFDQTQPPSIDILTSSNLSSATHEGVMDLIKTA